ncbi:MAG: GGDEF domain-containing protein [Pseudorhizobium sp.]
MSVRTVCKTLAMTVTFAGASSALGYGLGGHDLQHAWSHATLLFVISACLSPLLIFPLVRKTHLLLDAQRRLTELANTDALTGLPNRRSFYQSAEKLADHETALAAIILDIDRFKDLNDSFGHAVGDQVLKEVATRIAVCLSAYSPPAIAFGRIGGEEFACVLSGSLAAEVEHVSQALAEAMRSAPVFVDGRQHRVTVSVGYHLRLKDLDLDEVMKQADAALYAAKAAGRNQVAASDAFSTWNERLRVESQSAA